MISTPRNLVRAAAAALVIVLLATVVYRIWRADPRVTEEEVRSLVRSSIQREAEASFYVTGYLEVTTTAIVDNTRIFLPDLLDLRLGTTRATVRAPGRVSYGFDVSNLQEEMIHVEENVVWIQIPHLEIYSAEPDLSQLEIETELGWARLPASGRSAELRAIGELNAALRRQGDSHLGSAMQPRANTARALERLLLPVLGAAGIESPQLRFELGEGVSIETDAG